MLFICSFFLFHFNFHPGPYKVYAVQQHLRIHLIRVMISNFLCLPQFHVSDVTIKQDLALLIKKDFFQPASSFSADLNRAQELHSSLAINSTSTSVDLTQYQETILNFYRLISDISRRFPDNVITFEWFSTLRYNPVSRQVSSWSLEQAFLIYQLGAVLCQQAHNENIFHDEGVKKACHFFKLAAGCFLFLQAFTHENSLSSQDFDAQTLEALKLLMLAQAQEVIWLKAIGNPSMKNTLVARLSKRVADLYEEAIPPSVESKVITLDWTNHMRVKMNHFLAVSYYRMAIVSLDNFEYGKQVAFLKAASSKCTEALSHKNYVTADVIEDLRGLQETVNSFLKTAEKENDLVFLKPVPAPQDLPIIDAVSMVEPEIPSELASKDSQRAFANLVPFAIIQIAQAFKEREELYLKQTFAEPLLALGRILHQFLSERDLPAKIDTIQKPESIPDSIISHLKEIITIGGIQIIEDTMAEVSELALKGRNLIFECEERLRMESYEDEILRERGGDLWTRPPSDDVSSTLKERIEKMRNYIQQGHQSDILIGEGYNQIKPALEIYCGGKEVLQKKIPSSMYIKLDPEMGKLVNHLKEQISEANKMEINRQKFIGGVNGKSRNNSVLPLVLSEYKRNPTQYQFPNGSIDPSKFEPIYEKHLLNFAEDIVYVEKLKQAQTQLEQQIDESNARFGRSKEILNNAAQQERLKALKFFESAYVQYLELIANLNRALSFYSDFIEKGNGVLRELEEFLYSRREEARELTIQIQNQQNFNQIEQTMSQSKLAAPQSVRLNSVQRLSGNDE